MFDSPLVWCAVVRKWVALDESVFECMRLQCCKVTDCPISHLFAPPPPLEQNCVRVRTAGSCAPDADRAKSGKVIF